MEPIYYIVSNIVYFWYRVRHSTLYSIWYSTQYGTWVSSVLCSGLHLPGGPLSIQGGTVGGLWSSGRLWYCTWYNNIVYDIVCRYRTRYFEYICNFVFILLLFSSFVSVLWLSGWAYGFPPRGSRFKTCMGQSWMFPTVFRWYSGIGKRIIGLRFAQEDSFFKFYSHEKR